MPLEMLLVDERTLGLFVVNVLFVPTFYLLAFSSIPYVLSCGQTFFKELFYVKGCFAYICPWCPGTPEESSTTPGTGTQMLVRCCVGV